VTMNAMVPSVKYRILSNLNQMAWTVVFVATRMAILLL
jgi:hypothetical protein